MNLFIPLLAICKQCRARLSDREKTDDIDVVLEDPKSLEKTEGDEGHEHLEQCKKPTSSRKEEFEVVSFLKLT